MKLHYKINLTSLGILLLVSIAIVIAGGNAITSITYDLNRKLMFKELNILQADINAAVKVLRNSGVYGVREYRLAAQKDLLAGLKEKYGSGEDTGNLIVLDSKTGLPLLNPPQDGADLKFLQELTAKRTGTLHHAYSGQSRYFCYDSVDEWNWLLILYENDAKLLETRDTFFKIVLIIMAISLAAGTGYLVWSTSRIVAPLRQLAATAEQISQGNWDATLPKIKSSDEIAHLTETFRKMSNTLSSTYRDLHEHLRTIKRSQDELSTEKERLAITLRSIGDGVICTDVDGNITLLNKAAEHLTGWDQDEALGKSFFTVFRPVNEPVNNHPQHFSAILDRFHERGTGDFHEQVHLLSKSTRQRIISTSGAPIFDAGGTALGAILVFRDISESIKLQEELIKAHKLESVGILAGGIAHDFNNLLTGILGNISLAKLIANDHEALQTKLDAAEKASLRAKDLTTQLLTFSKGGEPVKKLTSLVRVIKESSMFAMAGSNCRCEYHITEDLWSVEADEGQISQVLHNLIINAGQAMPDGGTIQVRAENVIIRAEDTSPLEPGRYLQIAVEDSGTGIDEAALTKIFDPYFTTKTGGSGLGLASAYSIIKKHHGCILVESTRGKGSVFRIYLPASAKEAQTAGPHETLLTMGNGKVLVVDDEELVKDVTGKMLTSLGYEVDFAGDGEMAVAMYKERLATNTRYDLVIMDLTIPGGMGGKEAIQQLVDIDPEVNAIVSSGYANDPIMANFRKFGFRAVLAKPFNIEELSTTLAELQSR